MLQMDGKTVKLQIWDTGAFFELIPIIIFRVYLMPHPSVSNLVSFVIEFDQQAVRSDSSALLFDLLIL